MTAVNINIASHRIAFELLLYYTIKKVCYLVDAAGCISSPSRKMTLSAQTLSLAKIR